MTLPRKIEFDILIVGAGAAGCAAAVAATRGGARVALVERYSFLGGTATAANVGTICGLHQRSTGETAAAGAFANEFRERLFQLEKRYPECADNGLYYVPYNSWAFEAICDQMLCDAATPNSELTYFLHSILTDVSYCDSSIASVRCLVGNEMVEFSATQYVDASGEGILSPIETRHFSAQALSPGYVVSVGNLSRDAEKLTEPQLSRSVLTSLLENEQDSALAPGCNRFTVSPGSFQQRCVNLKFAFPQLGNAEFNQRSETELLGRRAIRAAFKILREKNPLFTHAEIIAIAPQAGYRSGPRGRGRMVLSEADVLSSREFPSAVACGLWPIEVWGERRRAEFTFPATRAPYQIPVEALRSATIENLLFCGRGISAEERALSSARVIGTCFATGYAAGFLAQQFCQGVTEGNAVSALVAEQYGTLRNDRSTHGSAAAPAATGNVLAPKEVSTSPCRT